MSKETRDDKDYTAAVLGGAIIGVILGALLATSLTHEDKHVRQWIYYEDGTISLLDCNLTKGVCSKLPSE